jgi:hypothetical protein
LSNSGERAASWPFCSVNNGDYLKYATRPSGARDYNLYTLDRASFGSTRPSCPKREIPNVAGTINCARQFFDGLVQHSRAGTYSSSRQCSFCFATLKRMTVVWVRESLCACALSRIYDSVLFNPNRFVRPLVGCVQFGALPRDCGFCKRLHTTPDH